MNNAIHNMEDLRFGYQYAIVPCVQINQQDWGKFPVQYVISPNFVYPQQMFNNEMMIQQPMQQSITYSAVQQPVQQFQQPVLGQGSVSNVNCNEVSPIKESKFISVPLDLTPLSRIQKTIYNYNPQDTTLSNTMHDSTEQNTELTTKNCRWKEYKKITRTRDVYQQCFLMNLLRTLGYNVLAVFDFEKRRKGGLIHPEIRSISKDSVVYYDIEADKKEYKKTHEKLNRFSRHNATVTNNIMIKLLKDLNYAFCFKLNCRRNNGCECFDRFYRMAKDGSRIESYRLFYLGKEIYEKYIENLDVVIPFTI